MTSLRTALRYLAQGCILTLGLLAGSPAQAQTPYRDISLDCGGWVSGFDQHAGSGRLYGYGDIFGLYRSDDFGATWQFLQNRLTENATFVTGVSVSPLDANRVAFVTYGNAWTSLDGGETWTKRLGDVNFIKNVRGSRPITYHPTVAAELWLATGRNGQSSTLWRSSDNGSSWSAIGGQAFINERATTIHISPSSPNEIWVGTRMIEGLSTTGGLWCSADSGASWRKVWNNNGATTVYYGQPQVHSIARRADRVSLFSSNTGVWQVTATNWNDPQTYVATLRTFDDQTIPNVTLLANGSFWCTEIGDQTWAPKISTDGVTWADRQIAMTSAYVPEWTSAANIVAKNRVYGRDMLVQDVANPNRWLLTGGASAHLSEDNGITWRYQPGGMAGIAGYRATFDRTNPDRIYLATADQGIFVVTDGGLSGKTTYCSNRTFNALNLFHEALVSANGQTIVGAGVQQSESRTIIIRSTDGGATWGEVVPTGLPPSYEGITRAVMSLNDANDYLVLLGYTDEAGKPNNPGLYRTIDGGANFAKVGGTTFDGVNTGSRYHPENAYLLRDGINPDIRYLGLRASNNSSVRGLWRSSDGGTTWIKRTDPFGLNWIICLAADPTVEGRLWASNTGLKRSDDGGGTWTSVGDFTLIGGLDVHGGRIGVIGRRPGDTFNKVYSSPDNGLNWTEESSPANTLIGNNTVSVDAWRPGQLWLSGSRSFTMVNPPTALDPVLTGTITGSPAYQNDPNFTPAKAFDGDTNTFFAPGDNGSFTQIDLGAGNSARVTTLRYFPRATFTSRMIGGRFEGSANGTTWTTLHNITATPSIAWQTLTVTDPTTYRYLRYVHPTGLADIAEIEFHGIIASPPIFRDQPLPALSGLRSRFLTYSLACSGTPQPTFAVSMGSLPAGLSLNPTTGIISGTPTSTANTSVAITATNSSGAATTSLSIVITNGAQLLVSTPLSPYVQVANTTANALVVLTNAGDTPLSWSASLPTVDGTYEITRSDIPGSGVAYDWIDAVEGGTRLTFTGVDDGNSGAIPLPFTFRFYGINQSSIIVCVNGWLSFTNSSSDYSFQTLPGTTDPENLIAPHFTDLYLREDSAIYTRTVDAQTFVISYVNLVRYTDRTASNPERFTFQAILKSSGRIIFQYQTISDQPTGNRGIGLQNATRDQGSLITTPNPPSSLVGKAFQFAPPLGWLKALTPNNSSGAGGSLAPGASLNLAATVSTAGINEGELRSGVVTFVSNDSLNPTRTLTLNLRVGTPAATPINEFRTTYGIATDGTQDALTPAGDGVQNLLKYAFNMLGSGSGQATSLSTPNASVLAAGGTAGLPLVGVESGTGKLQLTYIRRKSATTPGITYAVEFSDALAAWAVNASATESVTSIDSTFERVTVSDSVASPAKRFARVRVTAP